MNDVFKTFLGTIPLCILIIIAIIFFSDGCNKSGKVIEMGNQRDSIIHEKIDSLGRTITHTNRVFSKEFIKLSNETSNLRNDLRDFKIPVNDLMWAIKLNTSASGGGETKIVRDTKLITNVVHDTTVVIDTIEVYKFADTTKHMKLAGEIDLINDKMSYEYQYSAEYKLFSYEYKKKFWKRPELRLKINSNDPNNTISAQTFTVKPPREIISVGVGVGATVYYANKKIGVAPAITIGLYKPIYTFRSKK